jgi:enoyl-CoA hydratase/carnithine racemase
MSQLVPKIKDGVDFFTKISTSGKPLIAAIDELAGGRVGMGLMVPRPHTHRL